MTHKLAFALILQRSSDSAPLYGAKFYGSGILNPVEKPNGLYVFTDCPVCSLRVECSGMLPVHVEPKPGQCLPVCMYESQGFSAPLGYRIFECSAGPNERMYIEPPENGMRVIESGTGTAKLAVRRPAPVGGWLMFKGNDGREEPAFILEKKASGLYYLLGHSGGFKDGLASRIYVGKADENGICRIVLPLDIHDEKPRPFESFGG